MNRRQALQRQSGFTLVEIMVVVIILGILATLGFVQIPKQLLKARNKTTQSKCKELENAIEMFTADYTGDLGSGADIWDKLIEGGMLKEKRVPKDEWGQDFRATRRDDGNYEVWSCGADKSGDTDDDVFANGLRKDRTQGF